MAADNSLTLVKLKKERVDLERQRVTIQNNLIAVTGALQFCDYLIGVGEKPVEAETLNGTDPEPTDPDGAIAAGDADPPVGPSA